MNQNISEKILVADDDRVVRTLLQYNLKKAGYTVILVENGIEVLENMTMEIGVVLLDLQMPKMDGINCLKHLRKEYPDLAPVMITASDDISDAVEAMKYGAFDYLVKPVKPKQLLALVEKVLQNWKQSKRLRQVEKELVRAREREIYIASRIQRTLLLGKPPVDMPEIEITQFTIPSQQVDGDFFDFFKINDKILDIVVGDVMGKGIASALLGAAMKSHFLRAINELALSNSEHGFIPEPGDIVSRVHSAMISHMEDIETFVTLCYARIDLEKSLINFVDCGHMRTIHYRSSLKNIRLLEGVNMPLGLPETDPFEQITVSYIPGDFFFFYSDGLTEAQNKEGEQFGETRLVKKIQEYAEFGQKQIIDRIYKDVVNFAQSDSFDDDFTCVVAGIKK
ncbi:Two component system response regulator, PPM-type phosphatase domain-containing protein [Desulfonema limicola]|uniref:Two component system response regulator, PPM-type phosphatase domain-containing protein n=1 Tax=Desulfonema limicola TaxID=45656 RepID=A0A975B7C5_9BACT|nr:SpoIIE family protein phosphatase [Desulfonema limicola]QTA80166.1 Two component system response regulator, PPM-type phosphatase domain-containing protein [Desulfonema limicola]